MTKPEFWLKEYGDYLFRYALMRLNETAAAEDAVQETFLAGIKALPTFDGRVEIKYWLRGILRNKIVDQIRKNVREIHTDDLKLFDEEPTRLRKYFGISSRYVKKWSFDPAQEYENKEFWATFNRCLQNVKEPLRSVYMLKEVENEPNEKICKEFAITPNNLWVIIHRARSRLKECLNRNWKK